MERKGRNPFGKEHLYDFPHYVAIIGSMYFPLEFFLPNNPESYYTRNSEYAIYTLIFINYYGKILYAELGWPGSIYDNKVLYHTNILSTPVSTWRINGTL